MLQSALDRFGPSRLHVAIIMDGSGRWATCRGLPREAGHREGLLAVRRVVEAARLAEIGTLTLFAFSAENWHRPPREVASLLRIFEEYFAAERNVWMRQGVRLNVIGRRDRLPSSLLEVVRDAEISTAEGRELGLRIAIDFSGREAILRAAERLNGERPATPEGFARLLGEATNYGEPAAEVDLIIRSGGERRLSDFLLWESSYAELHFTDRMWPDFDAQDLEDALRDFRGRERRFGRVPEAIAG
jgi:undecaprenyl diphosphate synthase